MRVIFPVLETKDKSGKGARVAQWVMLLDYLTTRTSLSPIQRGFAPMTKKKGALYFPQQVIVYQLLTHGRWFSPGTPSSSTTKAGRNDIAESAIKHNQSINKSGNIWPFSQSNYISDMHVYHYRTFSSIIF